MITVMVTGSPYSSANSKEPVTSSNPCKPKARCGTGSTTMAVYSPATLILLCDRITTLLQHRRPQHSTGKVWTELKSYTTPASVGEQHAETAVEATAWTADLVDIAGKGPKVATDPNLLSTMQTSNTGPKSCVIEISCRRWVLS